jgi:hypothetical protein
MTEDEIIQKLYSAFGTNSGILFGIKDKDAVRMIVRFTMNSPSPLWAGDEDAKNIFFAGMQFNSNSPGGDWYKAVNEWLTNYKKRKQLSQLVKE